MATAITPNATETRLATNQDKLRTIMRSDETIRKFCEIMRKQDAMAYISSVLLTVANSPQLQECTPQSIIVSAMRAATLRLSCDPATGQAYLVPFKDHGTAKATLVVGYRGLEQLALRTGKYRTINVFPVYEGQEYSEDPLTGRAIIKGNRKHGGAVIGYGLYFELVPYFQKSFYMTVEEILAHAERYSKTFKFEGSVWKTEPDKMMKKTVMRLGLTRYGYLDPFDRMTLEQIDEAEPGHEDSPDEITGEWSEDNQPQETPAEKEARLQKELGFADPTPKNGKSSPLASMTPDDLKKEKARLQVKDSEGGLTADEQAKLQAIDAELKNRK